MKIVRFNPPLFLLILIVPLFAVTAQNSGAEKNPDFSEFTKIQLQEGEAAVWYLYHAGWAVKTANTVMIFDYVPDGFVDPGMFKDENVYVFISHGHGDHFSPKILDWQNQISNMTYIFGWPARVAKGHHIFNKKREVKTIGSIKISNIYHDFDNIPESAFLIEADGLTIYFSGDHGGWAGDLNPVYKNNIDYLCKQSSQVDMAFLSIFGSPTYEPEFYAIDRLNPRIVLPMHFRGDESKAKDFVLKGRRNFSRVEFLYPLEPGDGFLF
jgi:L-ascorbate metabolism protein UlaG (beta-lactamase superfamily)